MVSAINRTNLLSPSEIRDHMRRALEWRFHDTSLIRQFSFKNFLQAIAFANRVAQVAEAEAHHPDISISLNSVKVELTTRHAGGLTSKDFEIAAKVDRLVWFGDEEAVAAAS